jgi:hypothetical protein
MIRWIVAIVTALLLLGVLVYIIVWGQKMLDKIDLYMQQAALLTDQNTVQTRAMIKAARHLEHLASGMGDVVASTGRHLAAAPDSPTPAKRAPAKRSPRKAAG